MSHQAVMQPALDSREPESTAGTFERVLNTEEAAALLQIQIGRASCRERV